MYKVVFVKTHLHGPLKTHAAAAVEMLLETFYVYTYIGYIYYIYNCIIWI